MSAIDDIIQSHFPNSPPPPWFRQAYARFFWDPKFLPAALALAKGKNPLAWAYNSKHRKYPNSPTPNVLSLGGPDGFEAIRKAKPRGGGPNIYYPAYIEYELMKHNPDRLFMHDLYLMYGAGGADKDLYLSFLAGHKPEFITAIDSAREYLKHTLKSISKIHRFATEVNGRQVRIPYTFKGIPVNDVCQNFMHSSFHTTDNWNNIILNGNPNQLWTAASLGIINDNYPDGAAGGEIGTFGFYEETFGKMRPGKWEWSEAQNRMVFTGDIFYEGKDTTQAIDLIDPPIIPDTGDLGPMAAARCGMVGRAYSADFVPEWLPWWIDEVAQTLEDAHVATSIHPQFVRARTEVLKEIHQTTVYAYLDFIGHPAFYFDGGPGIDPIDPKECWRDGMQVLTSKRAVRKDFMLAARNFGAQILPNQDNSPGKPLDLPDDHELRKAGNEFGIFPWVRAPNP